MIEFEFAGRLPVRSGIGSPNSKYAPHAPGPSQGGNNVFTGESVGGLPLNETTLAEHLKTKGFATLCVGKWHLGQRDMYLPSSRGFDEYLGIPFSQDIGLSFWATHDYKPSPPYFPTPLPLLANYTVVEQPADLFTIAMKYTTITTTFITRNAEAGNPFFVYLPYNHIHGPQSCGARWCGQSKRGPIGDATEEVDWSVGEIMATLTASKAKDNTLVFFTSDNGSPQKPDGNLPLRGYKGSTWEGGYREPGIAWWPGRVPAGSASNALVATYDIFPTVLALVGVALPTDRVFDGIDIAHVLFDNAMVAHECITYYDEPHASAGDDPSNLAAMRCGDYKAYWLLPDEDRDGLELHGSGGSGGSQVHIFNLMTDPSESYPIASNTSEYAQALATTTAARNAHLKTLRVVPDQNARGNDNRLAICGAPDSQKAYPQWPNCSLTPQYWTIPICGSPSTWWCNQTAARTCPKSCPNAPLPPPPPPPAPPLPPMPASAYLGCYRDHGDNQTCDMPYIVSGHCKGHSVRRNWPRTVEWCNKLCLAAGAFAYFGVQMGGSGCFCGHAFGSQGKAAMDSMCNVTCAGDTKEVCGGPNLNSVYRTVALMP